MSRCLEATSRLQGTGVSAPILGSPGAVTSVARAWPWCVWLRPQRTQAAEDPLTRAVHTQPHSTCQYTACCRGAECCAQHLRPWLHVQFEYARCNRRFAAVHRPSCALQSGFRLCDHGHRLAHGAKGTRVIRLAQGRLAESMGFEMEELTQQSAR